MVYYNKELFAKKGVAYPKTFDEMMAAAHKLNDPANGISGFVGRGVKNANVVLWTSFLSAGASIRSARAARCHRRRRRHRRGRVLQEDRPDYGPQGIVRFNWNEAQGLFMQGKAAMWLDGIGFAVPVEDKTRVGSSARSATALPPSAPRRSTR